MNNSIKKIMSISIEEEVKRSYLNYAMSVIVGRALPDVRDGLKPVHRRILFAMHVLGNNWNRPYKKSARIVGDVIGKYHPHGDSAVYDTIVRMAQSFSLRYLLIDGQGNFGSVDGDAAAAMRYTEIRMKKIAHELLADLEKETVDFSLNYDGTERIPKVMPTKIPNLLINGTSGIAVGMATNIPPHNLSEVIDGCLAYINNKNISVTDLMQYIPGPDFPTAAIINGKKGIEEAYRTGRGKIYIRAKTEIIKDKKTGKENIIIYEIPYQVNKSRLIEKIVDLVKEKKIIGITNIRDESDKEGMRIVIEIKKDTIGKIVLNNLYSITQLQISFGINMIALHQKKPKILPIKDILSAFISHRKEVVTRKIIFDLQKARKKIHILEAVSIAIENISLVISLIKNSSNFKEAKDNLLNQSWKIPISMLSLLQEKNKNIEEKNYIKINNEIKKGNYSFTEKQAVEILSIRLHKLTSLEFNHLINKYNRLISFIKESMNILENSNLLMNKICEELKEIKKEYQDPRRTKIIDDISEIKIEDLIKKENVVITLSNQGYIKYQPITDYEAQHRGGKGKSATSIKEKDFVNRLLVTNTHDTILLFSSWGRMYWMKVYQLPESSRGSYGKPIVNLLPLEESERITAILPVKKREKGYYVFMATSHGIVKKTPLKELSRPRSSGIIAVNLNKGDQLIGVDLTNGNNEIMLFSAHGRVVRFSEKQIRSISRATTGVRGISLDKKDKVVSLIVPKNKNPILTVTKNGYGKRTNETEYPVKSRATQGVISIKVSKRNGEVVSAVQVDENDEIMIITDLGKLVRINISEIRIIGRNTQGVTLIRTIENEKVVSLQRFSTNN